MCSQWRVASGDRNTRFQQLISISHQTAQQPDLRRQVSLFDFKKTIKFPQKNDFKIQHDSQSGDQQNSEVLCLQNI